MKQLPVFALVVALFSLLSVTSISPVTAQEEDVSGIVHSIQDSQPRDFGYFPGDVIAREIFIVVDGAYHLQEASLPRKGALNYWLDLRSVKVASDEEGDERRYRITLTYQTFYVPLEVKQRDLPGFTLQFSTAENADNETFENKDAVVGAGEEAGEEAEGQAGDEEAPSGPMARANIPPWTFLMSPLREIQSPEPEEGPAGFLKSDRKPEPLDTRRLTILFAISGLAAALFLLLLAQHYAWGPFRRRPARPFTVAARVIKSQRRQPDGEQAYRSSLLALHRAFDETAGHRVFAEDVGSFLEKHPAFSSQAQEIARFYEASRLAFFKSDADVARAEMPLADIGELGARLGTAERRS